MIMLLRKPFIGPEPKQIKLKQLLKLLYLHLRIVDKALSKPFFIETKDLLFLFNFFLNSFKY